MLARLFLLFTIVPLAELVLLLALADATSWQFTLAVVLITGIVGATLARHEGLRCWQRVHQELAAGRLPGDSLLDALMILVAGALLVTPGVLTDLVGFALLIPPFRTVVKRWLTHRFQSQIHVMSPGQNWNGYPRDYFGEDEQTDDERPETMHPGGDRIIDVKVIDADTEDADGKTTS